MALRKIISRPQIRKTYSVFLRTARQEHTDDKESSEKYDKDGGIQPHHYHFLNQELDIKTLKHKYLARQFEQMKNSQRLDETRLGILGPELAGAHFIIGIGGAVKLKGKNHWIRVDATGSYALPRFQMDDLFVEGIDASNTDLLYDGLENIEKLQHVKFLNLSNCKYVDDFCLSKIQVFGDTLQVLDVSNCERVTENGIACIHHLPHLKVVNIANTANVKHKELLTLYIEEMLPDCSVHGVDHTAISQGDTNPETNFEVIGHINTNRFISELCKNQETNIEQLLNEQNSQMQIPATDKEDPSHSFDSTQSEKIRSSS